MGDCVPHALPLLEVQRTLRVLIQSIHLTTSLIFRIKVDRSGNSRRRYKISVTTSMTSSSVYLPPLARRRSHHPAISTRAMSHAD